MTVRAEHPKILDPVVIANTVDIVDLNREWFAPPFINSAQRAAIHKYTSPDQAPLDDGPVELLQDAFDANERHAGRESRISPVPPQFEHMFERVCHPSGTLPIV